MIKFIISLTALIVIILSSCVSPPDYADGLLENIPAIVDEEDYFSLSIFGEDYTAEKEWDIELSTTEFDVILSTLIVKDLNIGPTDSSFLFLTLESGDTIFTAALFNETVWTSQDSIISIGNPKKVLFKGDNFSGRLEYQIIKQ
tara:strand:+ start:6645 stop:7076 length:432 start_codon:yes stop_codon:yes gene_type:complete